MNLSEEQMGEVFSVAKSAAFASKYRWPNQIVPYQLSMDHTEKQRDYIEQALKTIEFVSCVKFVRRKNERDFIKITVCSLILYSSLLGNTS